MTISQITTHIEDAKARLLFQYRGKTNIEGLLDSLGGQQIQDLENILFDVSTILDIDNSVGIQLDNIGKIVGQLRNGQDDATYRLFLKGKAARNVSEGDVERILSVWKIITGGTNIQVIDVYPAGVELFSDVPVSAGLESAAFGLMQDIVAAGVQVTSSIISPLNAFGFELSIGTLGFDTLLATGANTSVASFKLIDTGAASSGDWSQVGNDLNISGIGAPGPALAALNGTDVAFVDSSHNDLRVYRFDGTDWAQVGNDLPISTVGAPALAALNGTDVAFVNSNNDLRTYRFDGTDWAQVGNGLDISSGAGVLALTALNGTDVAFIDNADHDLRVYRFDGTDWAQVGNDLNLAVIGAPALAALNGTDVAFVDSSHNDLRVYRFDGTDWAQVGNDLPISTVGGPALAALNGTDVAFIDSNNDDLRVYRFDGTDWAQVGNDLPISTVGAPALAALNGTDVAFIDSSNDDLRTYSYILDSVQVGNEVIEVTGNNKALVTNIDSLTQFTLDTDIFTSTPLYYEIINGAGGGLSKIQSA